jgi:hypothetical protein
MMTIGGKRDLADFIAARRLIFISGAQNNDSRLKTWSLITLTYSLSIV